MFCRFLICGQSPCKYCVFFLDNQVSALQAMRVGGCAMLWHNLQLVSGHVVGHSCLGMSWNFRTCFSLLCEVFDYAQIRWPSGHSSNRHVFCVDLWSSNVSATCPEHLVSWGHGWWLYRPLTRWRSGPLRWATRLPWLLWSWCGAIFWVMLPKSTRNPHEIYHLSGLWILFGETRSFFLHNAI